MAVVIEADGNGHIRREGHIEWFNTATSFDAGWKAFFQTSYLTLFLSPLILQIRSGMIASGTVPELLRDAFDLEMRGVKEDKGVQVEAINRTYITFLRELAKLQGKHVIPTHISQFN